MFGDERKNVPYVEWDGVLEPSIIHDDESTVELDELADIQEVRIFGSRSIKFAPNFAF